MESQEYLWINIKIKAQNATKIKDAMSATLNDNFLIFNPLLFILSDYS